MRLFLYFKILSTRPSEYAEEAIVSFGVIFICQFSFVISFNHTFFYFVFHFAFFLQRESSHSVTQHKRACVYIYYKLVNSVLPFSLVIAVPLLASTRWQNICVCLILSRIVLAMGTELCYFPSTTPRVAIVTGEYCCGLK